MLASSVVNVDNDVASGTDLDACLRPWISRLFRRLLYLALWTRLAASRRPTSDSSRTSPVLTMHVITIPQVWHHRSLLQQPPLNQVLESELFQDHSTSGPPRRLPFPTTGKLICTNIIVFIDSIKLGLLMVQTCMYNYETRKQCENAKMSPGLPSRSLVRTVSSELLGFCFLVRSPVLWTVDLMFCACLFFYFIFFQTHFFRRLQADIFETFPHDVALLGKEALLCRFPKSAP